MANKQGQAIELKKITKELGIDVPILDTKISGNKLVLFLYGGRVVEYPLQAAKAEGKPEEEARTPVYDPGSPSKRTKKK